MSCVVDFTEHLMMLRNHLLMNVALGCYKWVDGVGLDNMDISGWCEVYRAAYGVDKSGFQRKI